MSRRPVRRVRCCAVLLFAASLLCGAESHEKAPVFDGGPVSRALGVRAASARAGGAQCASRTRWFLL